MDRLRGLRVLDGLPKVVVLARLLTRSIECYAPMDALLHILHIGSAKPANHKSSKGLMALSLEMYDLYSVTIKFLYNLLYAKNY